MALPYKIPKKQQRDQCNVVMQSPLSRLQDSSERYGSGSAQKSSHTSEEMPSENSHSSGNVRLFKPQGEKPGWDNVQRRGSHEKFSFKMNRQPIKVSPIRVNGTPGKTFMSRPQNPLADRASVDVRWRPKRASDKLCQDENHQADQRSPYFKIPRGGDPSQAETNGFFHEAEEKQEISKPPRSSTAETTSRLLRTDVVFPHAISDGHLTNPEEGENQQKNITALKKDARLVSSNHQTRLHSDSTPESKRKDLLETFNRNRWKTSSIFCKSYKRRKPVSTEPIVLSSDDEGADVMNEASGVSASEISQIRSQEGPKTTSEKSVPSYIELEFSSFHYDTGETQANGTIMITDDGILIPLKGSREEDQITVSVTCSQLLGYGLWDGVSALLFLMVSDAQATLLQKELSPLHNTHSPDQACPFVLLVLAQRLDDLKAALLASLMDAIGLRHSIDGLRNALSITEGLSTLRSHPCGGHLLRLLGLNQAVEASGKNSAGGIDTTEGNVRRALRSHSGQQSLTRRLIQYPPPPSRGGITVSTEDLDCLKDGEFLNDVIIDFYLKYLLLERADRKMAEKSHIFSSFFYKQLTRKDASNPEEAGTKARYRRHQRVKTWTRHVDIFSKDYIFIPVNHEAHWYLVVICFPGLEQPEVQQNPGKRFTGTSLNSTGNRNVTVHKSDNMPMCTELHCTRDTVCRRPCILVMDSLKLSSHNRIYTLLREYLEVEWCVRKERARVFSSESLSGSVCRVPLQDNSSDCGLYLLQYVESFLQNPVVHFDLPLRLEHWFPRQQVRRKREELRALVLQLYRIQGGGAN